MDCARADWSAVTSALPNATLAGVLAGFLLNGIVVFLIRGTDTFEQVRALSFMFAAFVALALDSYLFGLVSGDHTCQRAWTEAMLAAGLLGIGAVAIIAGFGLMVAAYIDTHKIRCGSKRMLEDLFKFLRIGVAIVVMTALFMTSWNYPDAVFGDSVPSYARPLLRVCIALGTIVVITIVIVTASSETNRRFLKRLERLTSPLRHLSGQKPRVDGDEAQTSDGHRTFAPAIYLTLGYTILSVILACIVAGSTGGHWHPPDTLANAAFIAIVVFVLLLSLVPLTCLLVGSVPSFKVEEEPSPHPPVSSDHRPSLPW